MGTQSPLIESKMLGSLDKYICFTEEKNQNEQFLAKFLKDKAGCFKSNRLRTRNLYRCALPSRVLSGFL